MSLDELIVIGAIDAGRIYADGAGAGRCDHARRVDRDRALRRTERAYAADIDTGRKSARGRDIAGRVTVMSP